MEELDLEDRIGYSDPPYHDGEERNLGKDGDPLFPMYPLI